MSAGVSATASGASPSMFASLKSWKEKWNRRTVMEAAGLLCVSVAAYKVLTVYNQDIPPEALGQGFGQRTWSKTKQAATDPWIVFCTGSAIGGAVANAFRGHESFETFKKAVDASNLNLQLHHTTIVQSLTDRLGEKDKEIGELNAQQKELAQQIEALRQLIQQPASTGTALVDSNVQQNAGVSPTIESAVILADYEVQRNSDVQPNAGSSSITEEGFQVIPSSREEVEL